MQLDEVLEAVKRSITGCSLVAFGDLRTRLVLRALSDHSHTQEFLDQILSQAKRAFLTADVATKTDNGGAELTDHAVLLKQDGVQLFVRSTSNPSDVLCCVCPTYEDVHDLLASSRVFFGYLARVA